jgi:PAS domain S-box-containing protein
MAHLEMEQRQNRTAPPRLSPDGANRRRGPDEKTAEQHALTMLETVPDAVVNLDSQWHFLYVNAAAERALGRERSTLLGRLFWDEIPGAQGTPIEKELRRALDEHTTGEFQARFEGFGRLYQVLTCPCQDGLLVFLRRYKRARSLARGAGGERSLAAADHTKRQRLRHLLNGSGRLRDALESGRAKDVRLRAG